MITVDNNISYADLQAFVNEGVNVNSSNGMIVSAGTPEQIETRKTTLNKLAVVLDNLQKIDGDEYMIGIAFRCENHSTGLIAVPVVNIVYWDEANNTFKGIINVDRIPANWLATLANVKNSMTSWTQGNITAFRDAWPKGFVEFERKDLNE